MTLFFGATMNFYRANPSIDGHFQPLLPQTARQCLSFIVAIWLALLLAACSKPPQLPYLDTNANVLAFGDSLTFGTGANPQESYPAQLKSLVNRNVIAAGVPGEVSEDGLARLPAALDEHQPKLMILCHGGNDFLRKLGDDKAAANVRAMVKLAKDRGIAVMLLATPRPGLSVSPPAFYAEIAKEFSLPMNDSALKKVLTDNSLKSDLVHPNAQGYRVIAEELAKLMKAAGAV
jgi:acyl-CoA thioesterase I